MACAKPFLRLLIRGTQRVYIPVPCGYCSCCRRDKISMWSDRLAFESFGKPSTFLTLTYDDTHLPSDRSVHLEDWQDFHDRLRHKVPFKYKYFVTSEYGSLNFRPHYHVCLINFDWKVRENYMAIDYAWRSRGFYDCSTLNASRIRYCLKYMSKELRGYKQDEYVRLGLSPCFHTMSKGIGKDFFYENLDSLRQWHGYWRDGKIRPLPRYYADKLKILNDNDFSDYRKQTEKYTQIHMARTGRYWSIFTGNVDNEELLHDSVREFHSQKQDLLDDFNTIV